MNTTYDFAFSEQGYNHIKADKVCQDSSGHYADDLMAIVVVADGHGSDNYPRTDRGSSFAVDATITAIREFVNTVEESAIDISVNSDSYFEQLAKNILANWYAAVDADYKKYPFSEEELSKVSDKYKKRYLSGERKEKAYGTTLIAACQTKNYWFGMQIGDGKCVCISQDGSMSEPIPWDDDCQANITTSICDSDAIDEFRYCFLKEPPIATLMGTDGIDDSYATSEEMYVLYRSILAIFAEHGRKKGESEIQEFLPGLSRKGSGDDVSIAGIVSATLSPQFIDVLKAQCEYSNAKAQKEKADREVTLAVEKQNYVLSAMQKAKLNYDICVQKAKESQAAITTSQQTQEDANYRFKAAEKTLSDAIAAYKYSMLKHEDALETPPSPVENIPASQTPCPAENVDNAQDAPEENAIQDVQSEPPALSNVPYSGEETVPTQEDATGAECAVEPFGKPIEEVAGTVDSIIKQVGAETKETEVAFSHETQTVEPNSVASSVHVSEELTPEQPSAENTAACAESSFTDDEPTQSSTAEAFPVDTSSIQ